MTDRYADKMKALAQAILDSPGTLEAGVRKAARARAGQLVDPSATDSISPLPEPWHGYVDKVATAAHGICDEDVEALKSVGHDDDAIFEMTLAAALGAASSRLRIALEVINQEFTP